MTKTFIAARDIEKGEILTEDDLYYNNTLTDDEKKIEWLTDILDDYFYDFKVCKFFDENIFKIEIHSEESLNFKPFSIIDRYYGVRILDISCSYNRYIIHVEVKR